MPLNQIEYNEIKNMIDAAIRAKIPDASADGKGLVRLSVNGDNNDPNSVSRKDDILRNSARIIALGGL